MQKKKKSPTGKPLVFMAPPPEPGKGNSVFLKPKRTSLLQATNTQPPQYFLLIKYSHFVQHSKPAVHGW